MAALLERGEVVELSWNMAQDAKWNGYEPNVKIWWLDNEKHLWYTIEATDRRGFFDAFERGHAGHAYR